MNLIKRDYTVPQASELTKVCQGLIRTRLHRGKSKEKSKRFYPNAYKIGRDWYIPYTDLDGESRVKEKLKKISGASK